MLKHSGAPADCLDCQTHSDQLWRHAGAPWQEAVISRFVTQVLTAQAPEGWHRTAVHRLLVADVTGQVVLCVGAPLCGGQCCTPQPRCRHSIARPFRPSCAACRG